MPEEYVNLFPQEPVRPPYRPHVLSMLAPALWSLIMLAPPLLIIISLSLAGMGDDPIVEAVEWWFGGLYLIFVISYFTMQVIFWYLDAWVLLPSGLIDVQLISLFNRRVAQLAWNQVQDVRVNTQGFLASLFGFGDIIVQTAGRQGIFEMRAIPHARDVAQLITELSSASRREASIGAAEWVAPTQRLGEILIQQGHLTPNELNQALQEQHQTGKRLGQILLDHQYITREDLVKALGHQYHLPHIDLSRYDIDPAVIQLMPYETAVKYHAIPIHRSSDNVLSIAIAQPSAEKLGELMEQFDLPLTFLVGDESYIQEAITGHYLNQEPRTNFPGPIFPPTGNPDNDLGSE